MGLDLRGQMRGSGPIRGQVVRAVSKESGSQTLKEPGSHSEEAGGKEEARGDEQEMMNWPRTVGSENKGHWKDLRCVYKAESTRFKGGTVG